VTTFSRDMMHVMTFASLLVAGYAGSAAAQQVPTKTIVIYNNSASETIYPMIQAPQQSAAYQP